MKKKNQTIVVFPNMSYFRNGKDHGISAILAPLIITLGVACLNWYLFLPALNLKSVGFWIFVTYHVVVYMVLKSIRGAARHEVPDLRRSGIVLLTLIVAFFAAMIFGWKIFHAKAYASILKVQEGEVTDIPNVEGSDSIALMDTASAEKLGDRKIGSLTNVVSQFNVGSYVQINYQDEPVKVAALRYDGLFKWSGNRANGVPGYVIVNPVDMNADYKALKEGMKYVPSAYFNDNLERRIRFACPTAMFGNLHFEIDEEGNPWYVASVYDHKVSLFAAPQVTGAILANPVTGEIKSVSADEVPQWVDVVYPGDLITEQYNNFAQLQRGFWNSIFGQIDCRQVTTISSEDEDGDEIESTDYGYIAKDGDIWIYTGVTSVNGDSSNLGFILSNERTEETRFITVSGADEFSAMSSAMGEVQEKRYTASFPSLINIDDVPTYIMVLKDNNGLVKMYACVNVEQYNMVVTSTTQAGAIEKYRQLVNGEISQAEANANNGETEDTADVSKYETKKITVKKLEKIDENGNTYLYIVDEDHNIYRAKYADVKDMMLVSEGDQIEISTDGSAYLYPAGEQN